MDRLIAFCGLDCGKCDARKATVENDEELRKKVAKLWSELNGVEISPEMISCDGCRVEGRKTPFCDSLCEIRKCALLSGVETCGDCLKLMSCEKAAMITRNNPEALNRLTQAK